TRERDVAILSLFLATGIRVSELVGMNFNDIDFETNSFVITRKGGNKTVLYFSGEIKDALLKWLKVRENLKKLSQNEKALFISLQNRRISVRAVENLVKKYAKAISPLKNISPHKLRSTYGTNLYRATKDIYIVADVLGHRDVNTTKKHYAAISEDIRKDAATKISLRNPKNK
ncbi:MAG: tyrosine-type recombinase/integrase, partial [Clostridia bacterium]|nr:tyrosine-type recombinase/integrase [Clostridia bacterium]